MQKMFLTGGNGFIGKNFREQSSHCFNIYAPDRSELELTNQHQVDTYFSNKQFSCIVHAAAVGASRRTSLAPLTVLDANLRAFTHVFSQRNLAERFIHLGSGAEYGRPLSMHQIDESQLGKVIPTDEYGFSKLLSTLMLAAEPPAKAVTLHLFGVFWPLRGLSRAFYIKRHCSHLVRIAYHDKPRC